MLRLTCMPCRKPALYDCFMTQISEWMDIRSDVDPCGDDFPKHVCFLRASLSLDISPSLSSLPHHSRSIELTDIGMDVQVPDEVRAELIQILSNLVLGDNEIRAKWVWPRRAAICGVMAHDDRHHLTARRRPSMIGWRRARSRTCSRSHSRHVPRTRRWCVAHTSHHGAR
jgi:hypothetical protein